MPKKPTTWIDVHVGRRLCVLRKSAGISQQKLAEQLGVTYQQIQKYEGGSNRVSTSLLLRVAQLFAVPLDYFFADVDALSTEVRPTPGGDAAKIAAFVTSAEGQALLRAYLGIGEPRIRSRIMALLKTLGDAGDALP
ncbi:MAG TPA: helix-turn-helix domain-containing protein [Rhizomicrobium sp.]|nr:helix-turn-helix domain-containing protein [Rhizomicrobium sp.]